MSKVETVIGLAVNGHMMEYLVKGYHEDGTPITDQLSAVHSTKCRCLDEVLDRD